MIASNERILQRLLMFAVGLLMALNTKGKEEEFLTVVPLLPSATEWNFNAYWLPRKVGAKDFYVAEMGPWGRMNPEGLNQLKQVGWLDQVIPGFVTDLNNFDPKVMETLPPLQKELWQSYLKNQWPIFSLQYCSMQGKPPPTPAALKAVGDLWIGDGSPEELIYRLEPVFHFIQTGKKWEGSSTTGWDEKVAIDFFQNKMMPRLEKELPFCRDLKRQWTRTELRKLCDIYIDEWARPIGRLVAWGDFLSSYHIAAMPNVVAAAWKGADSFSNAHVRGLMRQSGGNKFHLVWRGHEPTEMYTYADGAWFSTRGDEWGYPLPHLWYYIYRPYLIGANYYVNECFPPMMDVEGDGQYELPVTGHILKDLLDFTERHPERGVVYAPVALMMDYCRDVNLGGGYSYLDLPFDDADQMSNGILNDVLFPEHRHTRYTGGYSRTAPYGEIFDILSPNVSGQPVDAKALANYKILFALGGLEINQDFAQKLMNHVKQGGALVINAEDVGKYLPADFLGVEIFTDTFDAKETVCAVCGRKIAEPPFTSRGMKLRKGTEAVITAKDNWTVVSKNRYGKGQVMVVGAPYMIQNQAVEAAGGGLVRWKKKPLLNMAPHLFEHLFTGLLPVEVLRREEDREDLTWMVSKKGDGWVVTMFNYSLAREPLVAKPMSTAKVIAEYPYREVPFQIVARVPVGDVMEWYADRDVKWEVKEGKAVISETMHGGEIRVYELQPKRIEMGPRTRYVNYALRKPVTASSSLSKVVGQAVSVSSGYPPERAVDGDLDNERFWWSDTDADTHRIFDMPQWLQVDLGAEKTIDHVFVLFHCWPHESLDTRLRIYKYVVEASVDGKTWQKVLDESKSEKNVRREGLERWFDPVKARYVKLTVLRNSALAGAQVVELKVMGAERETYVPRRKSIIPLWEVAYPPAVRDAPAEKLQYLIDLKPSKEPKLGWMPAGARWEKLNGDLKLITSVSNDGKVYPKSIYAEAPSELTYAIPPGSKTFAAAAGIGTNSQTSSVVFKVYVDGKEKYQSGVYRVGERVLPVVVDVAGGKELKLVVEDAGDGLIDDYSWWGEARFIRN